MPKPQIRKRDYLEKDLIIKKSTIPKAGKGLFTEINIDKDTVITEFTGEKISHTIAMARFLLKQSHSIIYLNKTYSIDSTKDERCVATYMNDAKGFVKITGLKNNAFTLRANGHLYIIASRKIKSGEELLLDYGIDYWKTLKHYNLL